jgi:hypothetical protein
MFSRGSHLRGFVIWGLLLGGGLSLLATGGGQELDAERQRRLLERYERMVRLNLDQPWVMSSEQIDEKMAEFSSLPLGDRIGAWADYLYRRGDARYLFGLAEGGYVQKGRLADDFAMDCILFLYRTTELGRTTSAREAIDFAYGTRFAGASLDRAVRADGTVDYDDPVHLDYSIDMIRSGVWGQEITDQIGQTERDLVGSERYPAGAIRYVPTGKLRDAALRTGDLIFLVSDETTERGKALRESGAIIGHVGVIRVEDGVPMLIHPASSGLEGIYDGGTIVKVSLKTYLDRVEVFKGVMGLRVKDF